MKKYSLHIAILFLLLFVVKTLDISNRNSVYINLQSAFYAGIFIFYGLRYLAKKTAIFKDNLKLVMVFTWGIINVLAPHHVMNLVVVVYLSLTVSGIWLFIESLDYLKNKPNAFTDKDQVYSIVMIALIVEMIYVLFKVMHWPFAGLFFILSMLTFPIAFLLEHRWIKSKQTTN